MSTSIYQTQPSLEIFSSASQKKKKLRLLNFSKQLAFPSSFCFPKLKTQQSLKNSNLFTQNYEQLGHPQNEYLIKKIQYFTHHTPNIRERYKKLKTMKKLSKICSMTEPTQEITLKLRRNPQQYVDKQTAYLMNQSQKIERLITRREQQQQEYKCLSQRIQIKLSPKKVKIPLTQMLPSMEKMTWYRNWDKINNNQKSRKKIKLIERHNSRQSERKSVIRDHYYTEEQKKEDQGNTYNLSKYFKNQQGN